MYANACMPIAFLYYCNVLLHTTTFRVATSVKLQKKKKRKIKIVKIHVSHALILQMSLKSYDEFESKKRPKFHSS